MLYSVLGEKNLLNKYQKKTPLKLSNIDFFLKNVYKDISSQCDLVQKMNNEIKLIYRDIYIWTESIIYLTKLRARLNEEEYQLLKGIFPLDNINNNENTWEDVTYYNMINMELLYSFPSTTFFSYIGEPKYNKILRQINIHKPQGNRAKVSLDVGPLPTLMEPYGETKTIYIFLAIQSS